MAKRYVIGIDFGTESGRAVLVDVATGREVAESVHTYANGVIAERLPGTSVRLESDWALQDPADYLRTLERTVPACLRKAGVRGDAVIGLGIDFTACTMLPIDRAGQPLCFDKAWRRNPHAWVKLWKHHAAQGQADRINQVASERGEKWLARYGGKISSEWFFPKALQILQEAPEVYRAADRLIEALKKRRGLESPRGRLVLIGAELDEPAYVEAIESQGALVVADGLCFGARSVLDPIDEKADDPIDAIGRAYFFRPSCARMMGDFPKRWDALNQMISDARADGVIFERLLFCDPWGADLHNINSRTDGGKGFPFLSLSREYGIIPTGQIRTRVQAFVEKIEILRAQRSVRGGGQ